MSDTLMDLKRIKRIYRKGPVSVEALAGVDLRIKTGQMVAIMGPSGSGKSTMMQILGLLDRPTEGEYWLDGQDVSRLPADALASVRGRTIGYVFQSFNLLPRLSVLDNVALHLAYQGISLGERRRQAREMIESLGLESTMHRRPNELSGGQQQRIAIARALVHKPKLILADEPTGNLDSKSAANILSMLEEQHRLGQTLILVTHDPNVGARAERMVEILDGRIVSDSLPA